MQTTKVALVVPILVLLLPSVAFWYGLRAYLPSSWSDSGGDFYALIVVMMISIMVVFRLFFSLQKGDFTRFEITIDTQRMMIWAFDRKTGLKLWEDQFNPLHLYYSKVQIIVQGEVFFYPALVYGKEQYDLVEEVVPYPEHMLLGFGEREELEAMVTELCGEHADGFA